MRRLALALLLLAPGCAAARPAPDAEAARYREAARYSREHGGEAVLVVRGDRVVFEEYQNGYHPGLPHPIHSGTKSFACPLAVAAQADGLLSLDEPISETLTELRGDSLARRITVRHLLGLTSGLAPAPAGGGEASFRPVVPAGTRWAYEGGSFVIFGELMRRRLARVGEQPLAYLERRVLRPAGVEVVGWDLIEPGAPGFATGALMTAREWADYGRLLRDGGAAQGRQLLPREALQECFQGSYVNPSYGLGFWLFPALSDTAAVSPTTRRFWEGAPRDLVRAAGWAEQRLYLIPSLQLVVVRFGGARPDPAWRDGEFLARLLGIGP